MKAIPRVSVRGSRQATQWLAALLLSTSFGYWEPALAAEDEGTPAVLKLHEASFVYRTSVAVLSCGEIRGRVASVLRALGAREDLQVRVSGCDTIVTPIDRDAWPDASDPYGRPTDPWNRPSDPFDHGAGDWGTSSERLRRRGMGPRQSAHVHIRAMMPVEMTPQVEAELKKDKSRRELISRVNPSAGMEEPAVFPAEWRRVELSRATIDLDPEECELMDQMSRSLLKDVGIRTVRRPTCARDRISSIPPKLTVEALLPKLPDVPRLSPAGGEEGTSQEADTTRKAESD
ncbi:MAG: hypothetical protein GX535_18090 [Xanthomonadaceae bacterium]|nr:hypothetical protein [Xanthomonadaceae bacterium]